MSTNDMIDSTLSREQLDEAARIIGFVLDNVEYFAGDHFLYTITAEDYRTHAGQFLAAYRAVTKGEPPPFPIGSCVYIERDGAAFRVIADPHFYILGDAISQYRDQHPDSALSFGLSRKFSSVRWRGEADDGA